MARLMSGDDILVTGWEVRFHGDESVGIFDWKWTVHGECYFDSEEDLESFRDGLMQAFSFCADEACLEVLTNDEVIDQIEQEEKYFKCAEEAERDQMRHRWDR